MTSTKVTSANVTYNRSDVNSCDVVRVQKVIRNNSDVENSSASTTALNGLKATNEKASSPSSDGVDQ